MNKLLPCLLLSLAAWALPPAAGAGVSVSISVRIAPPMLPVYVQPAPPADDFLWMPGYWAWSDDGYFWVPGTWVIAPRRGYLWTPGYWSWGNGLYYWHQGYWGPYVGFYGGVDYGYGYYGSGYYGGRWQGDHFYYNSTVNNVSVTNVHNTYNESVTYNTTTINRVSFNGGQGGTVAQPSDHDRKAEGAALRELTAEQVRHEQGARGNRALFASENQGKPPVGATPRAGAFTDRGAQPARGDARQRPERPGANQARPDAAPAAGPREARPDRNGRREEPAARDAQSREPRPQRESRLEQREAGPPQQQQQQQQQRQRQPEEPAEAAAPGSQPGTHEKPGAEDQRPAAKDPKNQKGRNGRKGDAEPEGEAPR